ncbi:hypothetical protein ACFJIS_22185 [Variovorax boronicumulans]|uniref:hypothetical protein n=1 Tax=Variovorax boronicumulans TaxID=436515 RepID=UPI0036F3B964
MLPTAATMASLRCQTWPLPSRVVRPASPPARSVRLPPPSVPMPVKPTRKGSGLLSVLTCAPAGSA